MLFLVLILQPGKLRQRGFRYSDCGHSRLESRLEIRVNRPVWSDATPAFMDPHRLVQVVPQFSTGPLRATTGQ